MSLINQMLKDLDERHAGVEGAKPLVGDVHATAPARGASRLIVPLALLVGATGVGALAWQQMQAPAAPPSAAAPVLAAAPAAVPVPPAAAPAAVETPMPVAAEPAPAAPAPAQPIAAAAKPAVPAAMPVAAARQEERPSLAAAAALPPRAVPPARPSEGPGTAIKVISPQQRSANFYRQALALVQSDRPGEAVQPLRQALEAYPANHDARQLLAVTLAETGNNPEAMTVLRGGLSLAQQHTSFSMALARLQVAGGNGAEALATMEQGLTGAGDDPEYHAFYAALLQSRGQHAAAVKHYIAALRSNPSMPHWLIGAGISLQAENKLADADEAFRRAIGTGELTPELLQFAQQRLTQIRQ